MCSQANSQVVGFAIWIAAYAVPQSPEWMDAISGFYVIAVLTVNLTIYNVSGVILIRSLLRHQQTGVAAVEEISTSKSASPFDVVIAKTKRSMLVLTIPTLATLLMCLVPSINSVNARPMPDYNPYAVEWTVQAIIVVQLVLGLVFTRIVWISKTTVDAEIMAKISVVVGSSEGARPSGASRRELKEKARRTSQSPKPPSSKESTSAHISQPDVELPQSSSVDGESQGADVPQKSAANGDSKSENVLLDIV